MSVQDARISTSLPSHPKTKKLIRRLGQEAGWNLVCLFLWAAANRSDGALCGMTDEDIELAAEWSGAEGGFVEALIAVRFLDGAACARSIHDWIEHNPWAAGAEMRSTKARWNAAKRHHGEDEADRLVPRYRADRTASSTAISTYVVRSSNAPSPSPSPSPLPKHEPKGSSAPAIAGAPKPKADSIPYQAIADGYNAALADLPKVRDLTPKRRTLIRTAWQAIPQRRSLPFWLAYFAECQADGFLNGAGPYREPHENWRPSFDYLLRADVVTRTFERAMDRMERDA